MFKLLLAALLATMAITHLTESTSDKYSAVVHKTGSSDKTPTRGGKVSVHYTGTLLSGKKFDSSKDRNQPFEFNVGTGQVIQCWDEVVSELSVGDHVTVKCPYETAYGDRGVGPIPAKSDLNFEIEMLKIY